MPFIVETYGGFGKDARAFIADLAKFAATTSRVWSVAETRFMVRAEVQRALFEGNLRVANAVLQESNPIRYASGRYHAVAPRPRLPALDMTSDADIKVIPAPTQETLVSVVSVAPAFVSNAFACAAPLTEPSGAMREQPCGERPTPTITTVFQPRTPARRFAESQLSPTLAPSATGVGVLGHK